MFKMLNRSKGQAVHGPRAQIDRGIFKKEMQRMMKQTQNLTLISASVHDLRLDRNALSTNTSGARNWAKVEGLRLGASSEGTFDLH